ncbi:MAG: divergent PAP2 family protein [Candidatus Pacebacteria bacterium]|nr:divergent PAP2 family protein [Candidatus Paceibacterota bacterium]
MYLTLFIPIISVIVAQTIKQFTDNRKFKLRKFFSYSGMPSGHSAAVVSLSTIVALQEGLNSATFAVSVVLALIVMTDAIGLRTYLGSHGKVLNVLVKDLHEDKFLDEKYPTLLEKIGHTPLQVLIGAIIGFCVATIGFVIFG